MDRNITVKKWQLFLLNAAEVLRWIFIAGIITLVVVTASQLF